jgi:hypothetical protein
VQQTGLFAEALVQVILRSRGLYAEQVVESDISPIVEGNFVAEAEDFMVWSITCQLYLWLLQR